MIDFVGSTIKAPGFAEISRNDAYVYLLSLWSEIKIKGLKMISEKLLK